MELAGNDLQGPNLDDPVTKNGASIDSAGGPHAAWVFGCTEFQELVDRLALRRIVEPLVQTAVAKSKLMVKILISAEIHTRGTDFVLQLGTTAQRNPTVLRLKCLVGCRHYWVSLVATSLQSIRVQTGASLYVWECVCLF